MDVKELLRQYRSIRKEIEEKSTLLNGRTVFGAVRCSEHTGGGSCLKKDGGSSYPTTGRG